jgi:ABC-type bacteriocin/lantibiotic exporter with double-glycine peptidase domain
MEEKKIGIIKRISKSYNIVLMITGVIVTTVIGLVGVLVSTLAVASPLLYFNIFIVFGILIVLTVITIVTTTILKRGSQKDAILKDSMKKAYTDAIDRSNLNPASKRRLER